MVWIEITHAVLAHKKAHNYPCVRVHFFVADLHFHIVKAETPEGRSVANYVPKDLEIADLIDKRLQAPNPLDAMFEMDQVFRRHGWELRRR